MVPPARGSTPRPGGSYGVRRLGRILAEKMAGWIRIKETALPIPAAHSDRIRRDRPGCCTTNRQPCFPGERRDLPISLIEER